MNHKRFLNRGETKSDLRSGGDGGKGIGLYCIGGRLHWRDVCARLYCSLSGSFYDFVISSILKIYDDQC